MDQVAKITRNEAEATENFNKVVEVCKKISHVTHQTSENERQANIHQLKLEQLQQECLKLEIDAELQKKQVEFQKGNVAEQIQILHDEKEELESIQQGVWKEMRGFMNEVNSRTFSSGREEAQKVLEMRDAEEAKRCVKIENLKLEGEIYALNLFTKFQEKRITDMENQIATRQSKMESPQNN